MNINRSIKKTGFTLIELLVAIAIISILAGMLLPMLGRAKNQARFINEINSAKQLMLAYQLYADDHGGRVLPGYRYGYPAKDRQGNPIEHPINARYPWRLAPYLADNFEIMYVNANRSLLQEFAQGPEESYTYAASVFPSLGINSIYVGGDDLVLPPTQQAFARFGPFCVLRQPDALRPSDLIVFTSARARFNGDLVDGFYRVEAPYLLKRTWADTYSESQAPELFGFVHPRYNERTVAGLMDGHAEGFDLNEIQDMRHWANQADRPDWALQPVQ